MSIIVEEEKKIFLLNTEHTSYAFGISAAGLPVNLHWGGRIDRLEDLPAPEESTWFSLSHYNSRAKQSRLEYSFYSAGFQYEPCLKLSAPDCALAPQYAGYRLEGEEHLVIELADEAVHLRILLHYELHPGSELLRRHVEVVNEGTEPVRLENLFTAVWCLPRGRAPRLTTMQGEWGQEYQVRRAVVEPGERVLESRNGISGHACVPFFAFDPGSADERSGAVWFGTLLWSGDWKFIIERDAFGETRVSGGLNNFDFELELAPGERFAAPVFLGGFTRSGFGGMSRMIHRCSAAELYPAAMRGKVMPVVFNTYSCIRGAEVTEENVLRLIPQAAAIGCELFIIDAGWQKSMGDWEIDRGKFPGGFARIVEEVRRCGMRFGLWVEFERVDAQSTIYREHPEWRIDRRDYSLLNLARNDVLDYIHGVLRRLIAENDIAYFKMDLNRYLEIPEVPDRRGVRLRYMLNFYELMRRLTEEFPQVIFENCAGGSGRGDLAMDRYFARINRSDNQDTLDVLNIEEGFTFLHFPKMAGGGCQISRSYSRFFNRRDIPLSFMAHAAMMGWPSLGIPLDKSSPEELAECRSYLELNRKIRHIVARGEFYRLAVRRQDGFAAYEFALPDGSEALLFVFGHGLQFAEQLPNLHMEGLTPEALYAIERHGRIGAGWDPFCHVKEPSPRPMSGQGLSELGIRVGLEGDFDSCILHFKQIEPRERSQV